jgi:N-acyl-D-aspartate/D-glutamate deacylase
MEKVTPARRELTRVLAEYVREERAISLIDAVRKMTLMPAQRLEKRVPMFKNKGRIQVGADADIAVFDPDKVVTKPRTRIRRSPRRGCNSSSSMER